MLSCEFVRDITFVPLALSSLLIFVLKSKITHDMASTKQAQVVITANATTAKKVMDELKSKAKQCYDQMQQLAQAGQQNSKAFKAAEKEFNAYNNAIAHNISATKRVDEVMKNLASTTTRDLKRALAAAKSELNNMAGNNPKLRQMQKNIAAIKEQIDKNNGSVRTHNSLWRNAVKNITAYIGVFGAFNLVRSKIQGVISDNLKFSDQLTDIRKVSGLTTRDVNKLAMSLSKLDTRTSIQGLSTIAYEGAKLGMSDYGVGGLEQFVRAANQVNVALKEELGDEALTAMSKITEVMGLIPKLGVEQAMLKTGSAMFKLSATSTATSSNIIEFAKRLTGMARTAGLTTDQLLALGSAADSMYLMPEVASTAFIKLLGALQTKHNLIEKSLQITPGTINQLFSAGRAMDAIVLILEKMKAKGNMNALSDVFDSMDQEGSRMLNVMVTMSKNVNMLKDHLAEAKEAFEEGTAVTDEYNMQQETAQGILERANNLWEKAFVNPDGVDNVKEMTQAWYDLSSTLTSSKGFMMNVRLAMSLLVATVKGLLVMLPTLVTFFMFRGFTSLIISLTDGLITLRNARLMNAAANATEAASATANAAATAGQATAQAVATGATVGQTVATGALTTVTKSQTMATLSAALAQRGLNAAMAANVIGAVISLLMTAAVWLGAFFKKTEQAAEGQKTLNDYMKDAGALMVDEERKLKSYISALSDANISTEERQDIIRKFNSEYGSYIDSLGIEINTVQDLKKNYDKLNEAIQQKIYFQLKEQATTDLTKDSGSRLGKAVQNYSDYVRNNKSYSAFDTKWIKKRIDAGWSSDAIYTEILRKVHGGNIWDKNYIGGTDPVDKRSRKDVILRAYIDNFVDSSRKYYDELNKIDKAFDPMIGDYSPYKSGHVGTLDNNAPDKNAEREAHKAALLAKQEKRYELKDAEADVKAIIDNIKNFYDRQITELYNIATTTDMEETLRDQLENGIKARMNIALSQARKSIADVKNSWTDFKASMDKDLIEKADEDGYNESTVLLERIGNVDIAALRSRISQLSVELKRPGTSVMDEVWHNASKNEQNNAKTANKVEQARRQKILKDNYTAKVDNDYLNTFDQLGFSPLDDFHMQAVLKGGEEAADVIRTRGESISEIFSKARESYVELLSLDLDSKDGRKSLLDMLFGSEDDRSAAVLDLRLLFDTLEQSTKVDGNASDDVKLFYDTLIKYSDDYTEALKKAADRQKKLLDFRWNRDGKKLSLDVDIVRNDKIQQGVYQFTKEADERRKAGDKTTEDYGIYGNKAMIQSFGYDPEVEGYKLKMELAKAYYSFLERNHAAEETLQEAQLSAAEAQGNYTKALVNQMKERINAIYELMAPIEQFGTEMGEALFSSEKSVKESVGNMINSFVKLTVTMMQEHIKRRIFQKINDRLTSLEMRKAAAEQKDIEESKHDEIEVAQKKGNKSLLKSVVSGFTSLFRSKKKQKKQETKLEERTGKETLEVNKEAETAKQTLTETSGQAIQSVLDNTAQTAIQSQKTQATESVQTKANETQAKTTMGIAEGSASIIGKLGWWGIPLVAVITALLNGLLSAAMSKVSSLFGGGGSDTGATTNTKLVSGMLTYDAGNVQAFRGVFDGKTYPVVGNDGHVYAASDAGELSTGLIKDPITTLINGQPALVAERGPEMVIGRETTAALMMARPDLISEIVRFDRSRSGMSYRAYDSGNVSQFVGGGVSTAELDSLRNTIDTLSSVLAAIQKQGIKAHLNKFGRGSLTNESMDGSKFMARYSKGR